MKKLLIIIGTLAAIIALLWLLGSRTEFEVPEGFELGADTPADIVRTIYNPIFDDTVTFKRFSYETGGEYTLLEIDLAPGGGNAMHYHNRFTETFIAVEGELGVDLGRRSYLLSEGEQMTVDKGQVHRFYNPGDERIVFQVKIEPGSAGFERALYIMYGLTQDGYARENGLLKEFDHTAIFLSLSDTRVPGIMNIMNPLFKRAANRAERSGLQDELLERYFFSQVEEYTNYADSMGFFSTD